MVGCETANQIWIKLSQYFASQTRAKVSQLKVLLQNVKKGSMTVNEYRLKIKDFVDRLASVGHPVSASDHIEAIFNGLHEDYNTFVISVSSRSESYMIEEIESLLLAQESRSEKHSKDLDSACGSINMATHSP